jgi:DNA-binding XRE family transcriptional regulator
MPRSTPNARRREKLVNRRLRLGFTQESLANHIGVSSDTIAAWERGTYVPLPRYRPLLADALKIHVIELDRLIDPDAPVVLDGHKLPTWFAHYESLMDAAGWLGEVEAVSLPGLLQTARYAAVVERAGEHPLSEEQVQERVERRLARQAVLEREPHPLHLTAVLPEHLLRAVVGGRDVMHEQLGHLLHVAQRSNVELLVVPADGRATCFVNGFELLTRPGATEPFMVISVDVGGARYHEDPHLIARFLARFQHLRATALPPTGSIELIAAIRDRCFSL